MADLDKVLKGLEKCLNPNLNCYQYNIDCPYESDCWLSDSLPTRTLKEDALELLKFQQAEIDGLLVELASAKEEAEGFAELLKQKDGDGE